MRLGQQEARAEEREAKVGERRDVMKKTKTTEITVETDEFFVVKGRDRSAHAWCETCGKLVRMITLAEAASIADVSEMTGDQIKARLLHATQTAGGQVLICLNSLLNLTESIKGEIR